MQLLWKWELSLTGLISDLNVGRWEKGCKKHFLIIKQVFLMLMKVESPGVKPSQKLLTGAKPKSC